MEEQSLAAYRFITYSLFFKILVVDKYRQRFDSDCEEVFGSNCCELRRLRNTFYSDTCKNVAVHVSIDAKKFFYIFYNRFSLSYLFRSLHGYVVHTLNCIVKFSATI